MPKYIVEVEETNYGFVYIEADSAAEAEERVSDVWLEGEIFWKNGSINALSIRKIKDE